MGIWPGIVEKACQEEENSTILCGIIHFKGTGRLAWSCIAIGKKEAVLFVSKTEKNGEKIQKQRIFSHRKKGFSRKAHLALFPYKKCGRKVIFCMESADFRRFTKIPDSRIVYRQPPVITSGNQDKM